MISADVKTDAKQQEIKELVAVSCEFLQEAPSKLEIHCKKYMYLSFNFAWYIMQLDIFMKSNRGGGSLRNQGNLSSVTEFISR